MTKEQFLAAMKKYRAKQDTVNAGKFVAVEAGKGLSTNDYTAADKDKLGTIAENAQVNVIESVSVNNTPLQVTTKGVNIDLSGYAKTSDISNVYHFKGTVDTYAELPASDQAVGDVYNVTTADASNNVKAGDNVVWNGTAWDNLSGIVDMSGYVAKVEGKGLSTIDVTQEMVDKWNSSAGAEADITDEEINAIFSE